MSADTASAPPAPLIAHVLHRLSTGGMENGVVNLINRIPPERYRHAVICMTGADGFAERIVQRDVAIHPLHRREGKDPGTYARLWKLLRRLRPDIVHSRNLGTLESAPLAWSSGVPGRVHGEHGWDVSDPDGSNRRYRLLRRALRPFVTHYIVLSGEQQHYLQRAIGVPPARLTRICNGVDVGRFRPCDSREPGVGDAPAAPARHPELADLAPPGTLLIGTVSRMQAIKDPLNLTRAFLHLLAQLPDGRRRLRLAMIGDGPVLAEVRAALAAQDALDLAWLPGDRADVPALLRSLDLFALGSRAEGISNTVLEAMACGLPVVATAVGGNPELVDDGVTGGLVPAGDPPALAAALARYVAEPALLGRHGAAARQRAERHFSLDAMVAQYLRVYDAVNAGRRARVTR